MFFLSKELLGVPSAMSGSILVMFLDFPFFKIMCWYVCDGKNLMCFYLKILAVFLLSWLLESDSPVVIYLLECLGL